MTSGRFLASTPGGIGNIGPALDVLGCAIAGPHDEVIAQWADSPGISVLDPGHPDLPRMPNRHTAAIAASAVLHEALKLGVMCSAPGIALSVTKGLPLSGGQGGSAASAVAGAIATNALLGKPLETVALLECCLVAEAKVAGRHLDNIAPAMLGGIVLIRSISPIEIVQLPVPSNLHLIIAHPSQRLATAQARRALPRSVALSAVTHQLAHVATMVAACYRDDLALFCRSIDDRIAEPARAPLIPGFSQAKRAALEVGALACSISGSGPSLFAITDSVATGHAVASAMKAAYASLDIDCGTAVTHIDMEGTRVSELQ